MPADRTTLTVTDLDPESRALLELSLVRGLSDEDLAGMLGTEVQRVRERRDGVLEALGVDSEEGRAELAAGLRAEEAPRDEAEATDEPEPASAGPPLGEGIPAADMPGDEPSPGRGPRRPVWAVVGGLTIAAIVALALALGANEDTEEGSAPPEDAAQGEPRAQAPAGERPATLDTLGAGNARATAQIIVGGPAPRLRLAVRGLPAPDDGGGYVVWLYNSVSDARELTGSRRGTFSASPDLPRAAAQFRFLDISREPADGNRNHSGASVLRAPIEEIPRASD